MKTTFNSAAAVNPDAPAYEPDLWNNRQSEEWDIAVESMPALQIIYDKEEQVYNSDQNLFKPMFCKRIAVENFLTRVGEVDSDYKKLSERYNLSEDDLAAAFNVMHYLDQIEGFQIYTNCYAYAFNDPDRNSPNANARPGERHDLNLDLNLQDIKSFEEGRASIDSLARGIEADGGIYAGCQMPDQIPEGYYAVAFYTANVPEHGRVGYHFARQNSDGTWSHKMADEPVTNLDENGQLMLDPMQGLSEHYQIEGFYLCPSGGLDVGHKKYAHDNPDISQEPNYDKPWLPSPQV